MVSKRSLIYPIMILVSNNIGALQEMVKKLMPTFTKKAFRSELGVLRA